MISGISEELEFLKYASVFSLADTRNVITEVAINPIFIGLSFFITLLFIALSYYKYNKKELI